MARGQRTPIWETHTADCAELRTRLLGTEHEPLSERVYTQSEEMQLAIWRAQNMLRLGEITPHIERKTRLARRDLAALRRAG